MPDLHTILSTALRDETFIAATLSKPLQQADARVEKITARPTVVAGQPRIQFTLRASNGRQTHENLPPDQVSDRIVAWLGEQFEHCHLFTSTADYRARARPGRPVKIRRSAPTKQPAPVEHNRARPYLIPENTPCPFLAEIGVMTPDGKVRAAKYDKFRQINRFLELVNDVVRHLPPEGPLHVVDFGCGKSYLTFALHHLLTRIHRRDVRIIGLDRNADVIRDCQRIAERLGCQGLEFRAGEITDHVAGEQVHLAVSLHACDTATDDALAKAVGWRSDVILAVPCCQHELAAKIPATVLPPLTGHGILRERFAALATDALRSKALEACGYRTQVIEFIDLEHTAKNLLIRAVRRPGAPSPDAPRLAEYHELKQSLGLGRIHLDDSLLSDGNVSG